MQTNDALEAVNPVVAALRELGVKYYLCGSMASAFFGISRATTDVDLVADLTAANISAFVKLLRQQYYVDEKMIAEAVANNSCFNVIYLPTSFKVDIFVAKKRPYDAAAMDRANEESLDNESPAAKYSLASAEDTLLAKLEWFRLGDEVSQRQWSDVLGVMKVQGNHLDKAYLRKWAPELGVADLLEKAFDETESYFT
jgi:hypothetical protein